MQVAAIIRMLGLLLILFSATMLPPMAVSWFYADGSVSSFVIGFLVTLFSGLFLWLMTYQAKRELRGRDGFLIVVLFWVVLSLFASIPLITDIHQHIGILNGIFESVSGLTTTGASVVPGVDQLPHALRYYRQQMQFFGGMGIIVLAVAVLPVLGIGGMQLYRAEIPGPVKENKLTPRIATTAKTLWLIYVIMAISCIVSYHIAGMSWFDAVGDGFSTVATGGFSVHQASLAYYHSEAIELIACVFMILSATNFGLHYTCFQQKSLRNYWQDVEFKTFITWMALASIVVIISLLVYQHYQHAEQAIVAGLFATVSMMTTTGLRADQFAGWPRFLPYFLLLLALVGGCGASTAGGFKIVRALLVQRQSRRELMRLLHPRIVSPIKLGRHILPERLVEAIWGFLAVFFMVYVVLILGMLATGVSLETAFAAVTACLSNVGVSIGGVAENYTHLSSAGKVMLIFAMFAGRLEVFSLLLLFTPEFWKS